MKFHEQTIPGLFCVEPEPFKDNRGMFRRVFCQKEFAQRNISIDVRQSNISENPFRHTLRGFHFQHAPNWEGKLITCLRGGFYDIVVDLRRDSPTFLKWISFELTEENRLGLYLPQGCANGMLSLTDNSWLLYYHAKFYAPGSEGGVRYNDPLFGFKWPAAPAIISDKDANYPDFDPAKAPPYA